MFENPKGDPPEMIAHEERLKALLSETLSSILGKEQLMPLALYHYTDGAGLLGMLETGEVWATHQEFMNDPSETEHAKTVAADLIRQEYHHDDRAMHTFLQRIGAEPVVVWSGEFHADAYVASFSEISDSLSQWRAYASNGRGYCMGIEPSKTPYGQRLGSFEAGTAFFPVLYGEENLRTRLTDFLDRGMQSVERAIGDGVIRQGAINRLANWLQLVVQLSRRVSKQKGYHEEREWRLVHVRRRKSLPYDVPDVEGIRFRAVRGQATPFVSMPLSHDAGRLPLHSVCLGPAVAEPGPELALRMLLSSRRYEGRDLVQRSETQYRG